MQTIIRSLLKEKRSRSCPTAEAACHHLGSSPYATDAAPGLPLYPHRTERLRASLGGSLRVFIQRTSETPGKTVAIAERSALSTDFPLRAERNRKFSHCPPQAPDNARISDTVYRAALPPLSPPTRPLPSTMAAPPRPHRPFPNAALWLTPPLQPRVVLSLFRSTYLDVIEDMFLRKPFLYYNCSIGAITTLTS